VRYLGPLAFVAVLGAIYFPGRRYFGDWFALLFAVMLIGAFVLVSALSRRNERLLAEGLRALPPERREEVLAELDDEQRGRVLTRMERDA
jgi:hypothetical protein